MERSYTSKLIGGIISNCGVLEHFVNTMIIGLSKDEILAGSVTKLSLSRRLDNLKVLLENRTSISSQEIKTMVGKIKKLSEDRNKIAHCIVLEGDHENHVSVLNWNSGECSIQQINNSELADILKVSRDVIAETTSFSMKVGLTRE